MTDVDDLSMNVYRRHGNPGSRCPARLAAFGLGVGLAWGGAALGAELPVIGGKKALASVDGRPVTLEEFEAQLAAMHAEAHQGTTPLPKPHPAELLARLVNAQLIVQEAERMGLDELPEVAKSLDTFRRDQLRNLLFQRRLAGTTAPDPGDVEALYRGAVEEFQVRSILFRDESDARAFVASVRAGKPFEELARASVAAAKATGGDEPSPIKRRELRAEFEKAILAMKPEETSAPLKSEGGFAVIKLVSSRVVEDPAARKQAEADALKKKRLAALDRYTDELKARWVTIDARTLAAIDYEAKQPGIDALRNDRRSVAAVSGEAPVLVSDLTRAIEAKFYHGTQQAIAGKKLNKEKAQVLDDLLAKRVVVKEALRLKLDRTPQFASAYAEFRDGLLFGAFIGKVVTPSITIQDAELADFHAKHRAEYTMPEMMRLDGIAFRTRQAAEDAVAKLRKGADLQWMRGHAEGQPPADSRGLLSFTAAPVVVSDLPPGLAKAVAGAGSGDVRFFEDPGRASYAVLVREVYPSRPQPLEAVKDDVAKRLFSEKQQKAVEDWAAKLRAASKVEIFADAPALERLIAERYRKP